MQRVNSFPAYSKFSEIVKVEVDHTYAVLINEGDKRGLFVFTVTGYEKNKQVDLSYAVKAYQVMHTSAVESAAGFDWEQKSDR